MRLTRLASKPSVRLFQAACFVLGLLIHCRSRIRRIYRVVNNRKDPVYNNNRSKTSPSRTKEPRKRQKWANNWRNPSKKTKLLRTLNPQVYQKVAVKCNKTSLIFKKSPKLAKFNSQKIPEKSSRRPRVQIKRPIREDREEKSENKWYNANEQFSIFKIINISGCKFGCN